MSLIIGGNLEDGRGNITAYATYINIKGGDAIRARLQRLRAGQRPDGVRRLRPPMRPVTFYLRGANASTSTWSTVEFVPADAANLFNFAPPSYFQRPDKRYTLGAFAHYDISDQVTAYTQLMFMNDQTVAQFAPAGLFFDFAGPTSTATTRC